MTVTGTLTLRISVLQSPGKTDGLFFVFVLDWVIADNIADDIQDHNSVSLKNHTVYLCLIRIKKIMRNRRKEKMNKREGG